MKISVKYLAIGLSILLLGGFLAATEYEYFQQTGATQYSAFGGWQMASNALYGYAYAKLDPPEKVPLEFRELHAFVNRHMDSIRHLAIRPDNDVAIYYLWDTKSPLKEYMAHRWGKDTVATYFLRWASMAPLYAAYGRYLIRQHPILFLKYYAVPNFIKYYSPPLGFMGFNNLGFTTVDPIAVTWFKWNNDEFHLYFKDQEIQITKIFPSVLAFTNLAFIAGFIAFGVLAGFKQANPVNRRILYLILIVWLTNMFFSVFAAPIELRYQLFPLLITFGFMSLLLGFITDQTKLKQPDSQLPIGI